MKTKSPTKLHHTLKEKQLTNTHQHASYPWHNNSCWLDTLLELTFVMVMQDFPSFSASCQALLPAMSLRVLFETFEVQCTMEATSDNEDTFGNLHLQRDSFRKYLQKKMIVKGAVMEYQPLFICDLLLKILWYTLISQKDWLGTIMNRESNGTSNLAQSYFQIQSIELHMCSGNDGMRHMEIPNTTRWQ